MGVDGCGPKELAQVPRSASARSLRASRHRPTPRCARFSASARRRPRRPAENPKLRGIAADAPAAPPAGAFCGLLPAAPQPPTPLPPRTPRYCSHRITGLPHRWQPCPRRHHGLADAALSISRTGARAALAAQGHLRPHPAPSDAAKVAAPPRRARATGSSRRPVPLRPPPRKLRRADAGAAAPPMRYPVRPKRPCMSRRRRPRPPSRAPPRQGGRGSGIPPPRRRPSQRSPSQRPSSPPTPA